MTSNEPQQNGGATDKAASELHRQPKVVTDHFEELEIDRTCIPVVVDASPQDLELEPDAAWIEYLGRTRRPPQLEEPEIITDIPIVIEESTQDEDVELGSD